MRKTLRTKLALIAFSVAGLLSPSMAQVYTIDQGGLVSACSGKFYDSGDSTSGYTNNEDYAMTFSSGLYGVQTQLDFTSFQLESCCDYLTIYDGTDNTGAQLYYGNGTNNPGTIVSTTGALYITFTSDGSVTYDGWEADISCIGTSTPNEIATTGIRSNGDCGYYNYPITATFWNGGTNDQSFVNVYYQINNGPIVSEQITDSLLSTETTAYTFNQLADLSQPGTYNIAVWSQINGDVDSSNDTAYTTVSFNAPTVNIYDSTICDQEAFQFQASGGTDYVWYVDSNLSSNVSVDSFYNATINSNTTFQVYFSDSIFTASEIYDTGYAIIDHNSTTGDDRGGIAVTQDYVYFNGDANCARYTKDLTTGVSLPVTDGLFSDLEDGQLYSLWNTTTGGTFGTYFTSLTIDAITRLDTDLAVIDTILLSDTIVVGGNSAPESGVFASKEYLIVYTGSQGNNFYKIDLPSGNVTLLNTANFTDHETSENWASWGFATYENGAFHIVYVQDNTDIIAKYNIATGAISTLATFTDLSDMASITLSPWDNRLYFHHESSSQFGGNDETGGYLHAQIFDGVGPANECSALVTVNVSDYIPNLGPDTTVCEDVNYALNPGSFDSYSWSNGSTNAQIVPTTSGSYTVTTTDIYGCVKDETVNLTVDPKPELDLGGSINLCEGSYLELTATEGMVSYDWSNGSTDQTLITNAQGTYAVTVVDANGCISEDEVEVTSVPLPLVDLGPDTVIGANSLMTYSVTSGYAGYLWSTSDTTASTTFIISNNQILSVTVTDFNGCEAYDEVYIQVLLGTDGAESNKEMNLYPNPASQQVYLDLAGFNGNEVDVTLIDLTGRVVYQTVTNSLSTPINIPVEHLTNGVYTVVVKADNKVIGQKKVVKN